MIAPTSAKSSIWRPRAASAWVPIRGTIDGQLLGGLDVGKGFAGRRRRREAGVAWTDQMEPVLLVLQLLGDLGANFRERRV